VCAQNRRGRITGVAPKGRVQTCDRMWKVMCHSRMGLITCLTLVMSSWKVGRARKHSPGSDKSIHARQDLETLHWRLFATKPQL